MKKIIITILSLLIAAGTLTGCRNKHAGMGTIPPTDPATQSTAASTKPAPKPTVPHASKPSATEGTTNNFTESVSPTMGKLR